MTLRDQIENFLNGIKSDLVSNYDKLGLRASGNWEKELETQIEETSTGYHAKILGSDYTWYLENGRKPNANQSPDSLRAWVGWAGSTFLKDWVERKGIPANPFAVAYKIAREGVKVPNRFNQGGIVSDVITQDRIDSFNENFNILLIENIKSDLLKTFK